MGREDGGDGFLVSAPLFWVFALGCREGGAGGGGEEDDLVSASARAPWVFARRRSCPPVPGDWTEVASEDLGFSSGLPSPFRTACSSSERPVSNLLSDREVVGAPVFPAFGEPAFGELALGEPALGEPALGKSAFGELAFASPALLPAAPVLRGVVVELDDDTDPCDLGGDGFLVVLDVVAASSDPPVRRRNAAGSDNSRARTGSTDASSSIAAENLAKSRLSVPELDCPALARVEIGT